MSFVVRPARESDLDSLYEMAKLTGGGFTNLPPERKALAAKLARSAEAFACTADCPADELFVLILENRATGEVRGTAQLFGQVGQSWPFYSYRIGTLTQRSEALDRTFRAEMLTLSTDLEGHSEVGGLFLHPAERAGGLGLLLARSRYLFVRAHRPRFGPRILAELRGVIDERGNSPFWDGVAGRFFGIPFREADEYNATHGNQFIADLFPKHPIYTAMLPDSAREVIGEPHQSGRAAMRMLEEEGFAFTHYVDIFDGGPTMIAETDRLRTVAGAVDTPVARLGEGGAQHLVSAGTLGDWRCGYAAVSAAPDGVIVDAAGAALLGLAPGMTIVTVPRHRDR